MCFFVLFVFVVMLVVAYLSSICRLIEDIGMVASISVLSWNS